MGAAQRARELHRAGPDPDSDFARALWEAPERLAKRNEQTPLRRIGQPHEIGPVAAFLASPAASYITGQVIVADGGVDDRCKPGAANVSPTVGKSFLPVGLVCDQRLVRPRIGALLREMASSRPWSIICHCADPAAAYCASGESQRLAETDAAPNPARFAVDVGRQENAVRTKLVEGVKPQNKFSTGSAE